MKSKVFIHSACKFPHGTPGANYLEAFIRLLIECDAEVVFITNHNPDYKISEISEINNLHFEWIEGESDTSKKLFQTRTGYADDRINAMKKWGIKRDDFVFVYGLNHPTFQDQLISFAKRNDVKLWCFVMEFMEEDKSIAPDRQYDFLTYYVPKYYDGVISISDFINDYYMKLNMPVYKFPPMISYNNTKYDKQEDKISIILPFNGFMKDDAESAIRWLCLLEEDIVKKIQLEVLGISSEIVKNILANDWDRLKDSIIIHDWMKYEALIQRYKKASILLLPRETNQMTMANFPSKVPETMNYGIIPIVSEVGDYTKYYLHDGVNSIVMKGSNPELCANAIKRILSMSPLELEAIQNEVYNTAKNRFDYHVWINEMKKILSEGK